MAPARPMSHIFISYARSDGRIADMLQEKLRQRGVEVWVDRTRLVPGAAWPLNLRQAIDTCDTMLVLLSPRSVASEFVRREYTHALEAGKIVIPVLIAPVKAFPEALRAVQWVDMTQKAGQGYYDLLLALDAHHWTFAVTTSAGYDWELTLARATRHQLPDGYSAYWVNDRRWYTRGLVSYLSLAMICLSGSGALFNLVALALLEHTGESLPALLANAALAAGIMVPGISFLMVAAQWARQRLGRGVQEVIVTAPGGIITRTMANTVGSATRVLTYRGTSRLICRPVMSPRVVSIVIRYPDSSIRQRAMIPARFLDTATITRQIMRDYERYRETHGVEALPERRLG